MSFIRRAFPALTVALLLLVIAGSAVCFALGLGWLASGILATAVVAELIGFAIVAGNRPAARRAAAERR